MSTLSLCLSFCHATLTLENVSTLFVPAIRIVESVAEQRDDCKHTVCLRSSTVETWRNKSLPILAFLLPLFSHENHIEKTMVPNGIPRCKREKKEKKKRKSQSVGRKNHAFFSRGGRKRRECSYHYRSESTINLRGYAQLYRKSVLSIFDDNNRYRSVIRFIELLFPALLFPHLSFPQRFATTII